MKTIEEQMIEVINCQPFAAHFTVSVLGRSPSLVDGFDLVTIRVEAIGVALTFCRELSVFKAIDQTAVRELVLAEMLEQGFKPVPVPPPAPAVVKSDDCRDCGGRGWLMSDGRATPCGCNPEEESLVPAKSVFPKGRWT